MKTYEILTDGYRFKFINGIIGNSFQVSCCNRELKVVPQDVPEKYPIGPTVIFLCQECKQENEHGRVKFIVDYSI